MKATVEFDIDLDKIKAELEGYNIKPSEENTAEVIKRIKEMVISCGEDSDTIYDAVDLMLE